MSAGDGEDFPPEAPKSGPDSDSSPAAGLSSGDAYPRPPPVVLQHDTDHPLLRAGPSSGPSPRRILPPEPPLEPPPPPPPESSAEYQPRPPAPSGPALLASAEEQGAQLDGQGIPSPDLEKAADAMASSGEQGAAESTTFVILHSEGPTADATVTLPARPHGLSLPPPRAVERSISDDEIVDYSTVPLSPIGDDVPLVVDVTALTAAASAPLPVTEEVVDQSPSQPSSSSAAPTSQTSPLAAIHPRKSSTASLSSAQSPELETIQEAWTPSSPAAVEEVFTREYFAPLCDPATGDCGLPQSPGQTEAPLVAVEPPCVLEHFEPLGEGDEDGHSGLSVVLEEPHEDLLAVETAHHQSLRTASPAPTGNASALGVPVIAIDLASLRGGDSDEERNPSPLPQAIDPTSPTDMEPEESEVQVGVQEAKEEPPEAQAKSQEEQEAVVQVKVDEASDGGAKLREVEPVAGERASEAPMQEEGPPAAQLGGASEEEAEEAFEEAATSQLPTIAPPPHAQPPLSLPTQEALDLIRYRLEDESIPASVGTKGRDPTAALVGAAEPVLVGATEQRGVSTSQQLVGSQAGGSEAEPPTGQGEAMAARRIESRRDRQAPILEIKSLRSASEQRRATPLTRREELCFPAQQPAAPMPGPLRAGRSLGALMDEYPSVDDEFVDFQAEIDMLKWIDSSSVESYDLDGALLPFRTAAPLSEETSPPRRRARFLSGSSPDRLRPKRRSRSWLPAFLRGSKAKRREDHARHPPQPEPKHLAHVARSSFSSSSTSSPKTPPKSILRKNLNQSSDSAAKSLTRYDSGLGVSPRVDVTVVDRTQDSPSPPIASTVSPFRPMPSTQPAVSRAEQAVYDEVAESEDSRVTHSSAESLGQRAGASEHTPPMMEAEACRGSEEPKVDPGTLLSISTSSTAERRPVPRMGVSSREKTSPQEASQPPEPLYSSIPSLPRGPKKTLTMKTEEVSPAEPDRQSRSSSKPTPPPRQEKSPSKQPSPSSTLSVRSSEPVYVNLVGKRGQRRDVSPIGELYGAAPDLGDKRIVPRISLATSREDVHRLGKDRDPSPAFLKAHSPVKVALVKEGGQTLNELYTAATLDNKGNRRIVPKIGLATSQPDLSLDDPEEDGPTPLAEKARPDISSPLTIQSAQLSTSLTKDSAVEHASHTESAAHRPSISPPLSVRKNVLAYEPKRDSYSSSKRSSNEVPKRDSREDTASEISKISQPTPMEPIGHRYDQLRSTTPSETQEIFVTTGEESAKPSVVYQSELTRREDQEASTRSLSSRVGEPTRLASPMRYSRDGTSHDPVEEETEDESTQTNPVLILEPPKEPSPPPPKVELERIRGSVEPGEASLTYEARRSEDRAFAEEFVATAYATKDASHRAVVKTQRAVGTPLVARADERASAEDQSRVHEILATAEKRLEPESVDDEEAPLIHDTIKIAPVPATLPPEVRVEDVTEPPGPVYVALSDGGKGEDSATLSDIYSHSLNRKHQRLVPKIALATSNTDVSKVGKADKEPLLAKEVEKEVEKDQPKASPERESRSLLRPVEAELSRSRSSGGGEPVYVSLSDAGQPLSEIYSHSLNRRSQRLVPRIGLATSVPELSGAPRPLPSPPQFDSPPQQDPNEVMWRREGSAAASPAERPVTAPEATSEEVAPEATVPRRSTQLYVNLTPTGQPLGELYASNHGLAGLQVPGKRLVPRISLARSNPDIGPATVDEPRPHSGGLLSVASRTSEASGTAEIIQARQVSRLDESEHKASIEESQATAKASVEEASERLRVTGKPPKAPAKTRAELKPGGLSESQTSQATYYSIADAGGQPIGSLYADASLSRRDKRLVPRIGLATSTGDVSVRAPSPCGGASARTPSPSVALGSGDGSTLSEPERPGTPEPPVEAGDSEALLGGSAKSASSRVVTPEPRIVLEREPIPVRLSRGSERGRPVYSIYSSASSQGGRRIVPRVALATSAPDLSDEGSDGERRTSPQPPKDLTRRTASQPKRGRHGARDDRQPLVAEEQSEALYVSTSDAGRPLERPGKRLVRRFDWLSKASLKSPASTSSADLVAPATPDAASLPLSAASTPAPLRVEVSRPQQSHSADAMETGSVTAPETALASAGAVPTAVLAMELRRELDAARESSEQRQEVEEALAAAHAKQRRLEAQRDALQASISYEQPRGAAEPDRESATTLRSSTRPITSHDQSDYSPQSSATNTLGRPSLSSRQVTYQDQSSLSGQSSATYGRPGHSLSQTTSYSEYIPPSSPPQSATGTLGSNYEQPRHGGYLTPSPSARTPESLIGSQEVLSSALKPSEADYVAASSHLEETRRQEGLNVVIHREETIVFQRREAEGNYRLSDVPPSPEEQRRALAQEQQPRKPLYESPRRPAAGQSGREAQMQRMLQASQASHTASLNSRSQAYQETLDLSPASTAQRPSRPVSRQSPEQGLPHGTTDSGIRVSPPPRAHSTPVYSSEAQLPLETSLEEELPRTSPVTHIVVRRAPTSPSPNRRLVTRTSLPTRPSSRGGSVGRSTRRSASKAPEPGYHTLSGRTLSGSELGSTLSDLDHVPQTKGRNRSRHVRYEWVGEGAGRGRSMASNPRPPFAPVDIRIN